MYSHQWMCGRSRPPSVRGGRHLKYMARDESMGTSSKYTAFPIEKKDSSIKSSFAAVAASICNELSLAWILQSTAYGPMRASDHVQSELNGRTSAYRSQLAPRPRASAPRGSPHDSD